MERGNEKGGRKKEKRVTEREGKRDEGDERGQRISRGEREKKRVEGGEKETFPL